MTEAERVIACAVLLVQRRPVGTTVKIITFYNQQRTILDKLLEERRAKSSVNCESPLSYIDVCSIDGCQVTPLTCTYISCFNTLVFDIVQYLLAVCLQLHMYARIACKPITINSVCCLNVQLIMYIALMFRCAHSVHNISINHL
jgi:AAA domain